RDVPAHELRTWVQAMAVTENAFGRAAYLNGHDAVKVITAFEGALSLLPELGDAHVNIASALLRARRNYDDWAERSQRHLPRALGTTPRDGKARYLQGRIYALGGDFDRARDAYESAAADGDEWATIRLSELDWAAGKQKEALQRIRRPARTRAASAYRAE